MNQKVMLLLGLVVPFAIAGCNTNPVAVPKSEDTPLLFEQEAISQSSKVDLLWMIDDSGSMAEEQTDIVANLDGVARRLATVDFRVAVTTTDPLKNAGGEKVQACGGTGIEVCKRGQFRTSASLKIGSAGSYTQAKLRNLVDLAFGNGCVDTSKFSTSDKDELDKAINSFTGPQDVSAVAGKMPGPGKFRKIGPILKFADYDHSDGKLTDTGIGKLRNDLTCLLLVGMDGSGIETGLASVVDAVKSGAGAPNQGNDALVLPSRPNAKTVVVMVSDENDCTSTPVEIVERGVKHKLDINHSNCLAVACNVFNYKGAEDDPKNPLVSPKVLSAMFMKNLRASRGNLNYSEDQVSMVAVTGSALPQPGETLNIFTPKAARMAGAASCSASKGEHSCTISNGTVPDKSPAPQKRPFTPGSTVGWEPFWSVDGHPAPGGVKADVFCTALQNPPRLEETSKVKLEQLACQTGFGSAVSGDRYYRFIEHFSNRFPKNRGDLGAICEGSVKGVLEELNKYISTDDGACISQKLLSCEEGASPGSPCGDGGTCKEYPKSGNNKQYKGLYCSSAIQPTLSCVNETSFNQLKSHCKDGSISGTSCLLKETAFTTNQACSAGTGVQVELHPDTLKKDISSAGCSLQLDFSAFLVEGEDSQ